MTTPADPAQPQVPQPAGDSAGFFAALFDFEFKTFVALKFIKVIYIVAIVLVGLAALAVFFAALANGQILYALLSLVFIFFYLILIRVSLEVIALLFRIGSDTQAIREGQSRGA